MFCDLLYFNLLFTVHFSERFNNENKLYIQVVNKYGQVVNLLTVVTALLILSDLLQGCSNKSDTVMI